MTPAWATRTRRRAVLARAGLVVLAAALALLTACSGDGGDATATSTGATAATATATAITRVAPPVTASRPPGGTPPATETAATTPVATPEPAWPPSLGHVGVDTAVAALRARDIDALLSLVTPARAGCTTALGAGGPPKCPAGVADGTSVEYFPYFECDGWGSTAALRARMTDTEGYALVVLGYDPPVGALTDEAPTITQALVVVQAGFGANTAASDARLLTTLAFDDTSIREINSSCGAYSEAAFEAGDLPEIGEATVLWRRYAAR